MDGRTENAKTISLRLCQGIINTTPESLKARKVYTFQHFSFYAITLRCFIELIKGSHISISKFDVFLSLKFASIVLIIVNFVDSGSSLFADVVVSGVSQTQSVK